MKGTLVDLNGVLGFGVGKGVKNECGRVYL